jgi:hypothetical protein
MTGRKDEMPDKEKDRKEIDRRTFLRRAALTGAATAWVAPVVQSIAATPAFAQTVGGTPVPEDCFHSNGGRTGTGCMGACTAAGCTGEACDGTDPDPCNPNYGGEGPCQYLCPSGQGGGNPCCNPGLCDPRNFQCLTVRNCERHGPKYVQIAVYTGLLSGCPPVPPPP